MTLRLAQLRLAAVALLTGTSAMAVLSLTGSPAHAFTMENLSSGGSNARFADPDERVKNFGQDSQPFGPNGPIVRFGGGTSPYRPFPHGYMPPPMLNNNGNNN